MNTETLFWSFAVFGTVLFVLRTALMFSGIGHDFGASHDVYHEVDTATGSEHSFKLFSLQTLTAFVMMFGWAGLAALKQFELGTALSVVVALAVGVVFMYLIAFFMRALLKLETDGIVFKIEDTIGTNASVYERIPASGLGRIQIHAGGMLREVQAVSEKGEVIDSARPVVVVRVVDSQTVSVQPVN